MSAVANQTQTLGHFALTTYIMLNSIGDKLRTFTGTNITKCKYNMIYYIY